MSELDTAAENVRKYVKMGLNLQDALDHVTKQINTVRDMYDTKSYSDTFQAALLAELHRLNIESSALHRVIREMQS